MSGERALYDSGYRPDESADVKLVDAHGRTVGYFDKVGGRTTWLVAIPPLVVFSGLHETRAFAIGRDDGVGYAAARFSDDVVVLPMSDLGNVDLSDVAELLDVRRREVEERPLAIRLTPHVLPGGWSVVDVESETPLRCRGLVITVAPDERAKARLLIVRGHGRNLVEEERDAVVHEWVAPTPARRKATIDAKYVGNVLEDLEAPDGHAFAAFVVPIETAVDEIVAVKTREFLDLAQAVRSLTLLSSALLVAAIALALGWWLT